jgi:alpha-galactosidase
MLSLALLAALECMPMSLPASDSFASIASTTRQWARSAFAEAKDAGAPPSRLVVVHEDVAGDTHLRRGAGGGPMRLGERTFAHGIGVNSHSVLRVELDAPARMFTALIGLDRNVDNTAASVRFHVQAGGTELFSTPVMRAGATPVPIAVQMHGARSFDLIVDDGGDGRGWDQGDWADARVTLEDGRTLWLDSLAGQATLKPGLPFSFTYGGRPSSELVSNWRREVHVVALPTAEKRTVVLTDPETGLEVTAEATVYLDTAGADWTLHFRNTGTAETPLLEDVRAVDASVRLGLGAKVALHRLRGSAHGPVSWQPIDEQVAAGATARLVSADGRTAAEVGPFFTVDWGTGGVATAVGWSGQWQAAIERPTGGDMRISAGMQGVHLRLKPGESIRSPRILQVHYAEADMETAHNALRRTMLAHVLPRIDGKAVTPPIIHLSTSFYEMNATTEQNLTAHLRSVEGLGFEVFWLDAYWTRGGFPDGMGNYALPLSSAEPPDRFPHGLKPMGRAVRQAGMKFLMWFEPERVASGTIIAKQHPEWVLSPAGDGSGLLDLGNPAAREHITRYLTEAIREYDLSWLRIDFNINPLPYWQHGDRANPDRAGLTEIRYVEGLYRLWDDLRREYPHLAIDNCASGGTRIDLETCSRSIPLWRTDDTIGPLFDLDFNEAAIRNQIMTDGLSPYVPYSVSGMMGSSPYLFRSGSNAGIAFAEDVRPAQYPKAELKRAIAEAKRLRGYYSGDLHVLTATDHDPRNWSVRQYDRPQQGDGMVVAFRRHLSPFCAFDCDLRGIDPKATYSVRRSAGYTRGKAETMTGAQLAKLQVTVPSKPGSVVVEYARLK